MAQARPQFGYWAIRAGARGNINRHILHYAGVDFEDKMYTLGEPEWPAFKTSGVLEFPNLPYIIDGDVKITEHKAVTAYICEKWAPQLMGANHAEKGRVLMLFNILSDTQVGFVAMIFKTEDRNEIIEKAMSLFVPIAAALGDD